MTIRAAGILFVTADDRALFLQRAPDGDHAGEWCIPGGKLEEGETPEDAAFREAREEAGRRVPKGQRAVLSRTVAPAGPAAVEVPGQDVPAVAVPDESVDFTTFVQRVDEPFDVEICDESAGFAWAPLDNPPLPLHPGVAVSLRRYFGNELDVAMMIAEGAITSPQRYQNVTLFDIRIFGTGVAYRSTHDEYAHRDPANYLNSETLARCNGLPVVWDHPKQSLLDSKEFADRVVGTVFYPYVKGDEVWAVAKIWDDVAIRDLERGELSTSPAVNFRVDDNTKIKLENGETLLIEGKPSLVDHIAIVKNGVWDKGGPPNGVNVTKADSDMTDEERKAADKAKADAEAAAKAKADADDARWAKLDAFMDSTAKRMDALEARKADAAKADDKESEVSNEAKDEPVAGDDEEAKRKEGEKAVDKKDSAKKDSKKADEDDEDEKKRKEARDDAAKADAALRAENEDMRKRLLAIEAGLAKMPRPATEADLAALSKAQARADSVYQQFSLRAPRFMDGETEPAYRRRLVQGVQSHSAQWKGLDLGKLSDPEMFDRIETQVYADAAVAARNPADLGEGELRAVETFDDTGRKITSFYGQPRSWMDHFACSRQRVTGWNNGSKTN